MGYRKQTLRDGCLMCSPSVCHWRYVALWFTKNILYVGFALREFEASGIATGIQRERSQCLLAM